MKFLPNRVLRLYCGGSGIDHLCGISPAIDCQYPENWIASCIEGNGRLYHSPGHGISKVIIDGEEKPFPEILDKYSDEILGPNHLKKHGKELGVLIKLLDSTEQLPIQVHPTRKDAKRLFNSPYGKTEAWVVLATREVNGQKPYLLVGFNEKMNKDVFTKESLAGKYENGLSMFHRLEVCAGDVILIRGGLPHAIGPGVTMVEVMEPSDWVIVPEIDCCGVQLTETQRFSGLAPDEAMTLFDFRPEDRSTLMKRCMPVKKIVKTNAGGVLYNLLSLQDCEYFTIQELSLQGEWLLKTACRVGVVVEGNAQLGDLDLNTGDSFLVPHKSSHQILCGMAKIIFIEPG